MGISNAVTVYNASVAAGASATVKVSGHSAESLLVIWTMTDAAASGDIGTTTVKPYTPSETSARADRTSAVVNTPLPATAIAPAGLEGSVAAKADRYDVRGLEAVELKLTNAAAAARTVEIHVYQYG